jgi:hypothetical protein
MFSSWNQKMLLKFEDISHPTTLIFFESFWKATHVEVFTPRQHLGWNQEPILKDEKSLACP